MQQQAEQERFQQMARAMMGENPDIFGDAGGIGRAGGRGGRGTDGTNYQAKSRFGEFVDTFTDLVCCAQEFVRKFHGGERSSSSLRDVARCIKVYRWFGEHASSQEEAKLGKHKAFSRVDFFSVQPTARQAVRDALIMSIAYCYHSRLPRNQRLHLRHALTDAWEEMQEPGRYVLQAERTWMML